MTASFIPIISYPIEQTWDRVVHYGYKQRSEKFDGKKIWQDLSSFYSLFNFPIGDIASPFLQELVKQVDIKELVDDVSITIGTQTLLKSSDLDHPIVQLVRLPAKCQFRISFVILMQIAFNVGQYELEKKRGTLSPEVVEFVERNELNKMATYVGHISLRTLTKIN